MENDELSKTIVKAPKNAKYTSHDIQKQTLHVFSVRVKNAIREEIGVSKYCIIVDEARDESKKCKSLTLKNAIYSALAHYNLDVQNIRGQGYDGASNMRGEFNGLQSLIVKDLLSMLIDGAKLARGHQDITIGHHYRVDFFYAAIDSQMQEINVRFSEDATELLMLSSALNPQNASEALRILDICKLVDKFYAQDFTSAEKESLKMQLKHYEHNVVKGSDFKTLSTISELCQWLVKTNKSATYDLIFRVIVLVLTLPVSTATAE
ncbi:uncharacterized protein LOC109821582 [Asparagus officinalis]|uniref:uncharacterized protein LOC109821582 n=1 Tax=Asparagus officinalis TaxID=4686 RepID=UPI00098E855A|nr:uncharacterized protein LOC109821582 [Asparagus officinalis]